MVRNGIVSGWPGLRGFLFVLVARGLQSGVHLLCDLRNLSGKGPVEQEVPGRCEDGGEMPSAFDLGRGCFGEGLMDQWRGEPEGSAP